MKSLVFILVFILVLPSCSLADADDEAVFCAEHNKQIDMKIDSIKRAGTKLSPTNNKRILYLTQLKCRE